MIERNNPAKCVLVQYPNNSRSANALLPLIIHNVQPGSIILTDEWRAYHNLYQHGYQHQTVNHSLHFRDPQTGVHTNTVEGMWAAAKCKFRRMHGTSSNLMDSYFSEFVWNKKFPERKFEHLIHQISEYYVV